MSCTKNKCTIHRRLKLDQLFDVLRRLTRIFSRGLTRTVLKLARGWGLFMAWTKWPRRRGAMGSAVRHSVWMYRGAGVGVVGKGVERVGVGVSSASELEEEDVVVVVDDNDDDDDDDDDD